MPFSPILFDKNSFALSRAESSDDPTQGFAFRVRPGLRSHARPGLRPKPLEAIGEAERGEVIVGDGLLKRLRGGS